MPRVSVIRILAVLFLVTLTAPFASADVTVWGPRVFSIAAGKRVTQRVTVELPGGCTTGAIYTLVVQNGAAPDGSDRVSSGSVLVNAIAVVNPSDLNQQVGIVEKTFTSAAAISLDIDLNGGPRDANVTITIRRHIDVREAVLDERRFTTTQKNDHFEAVFPADRLTEQFSLIATRIGAQGGLKSAAVTVNGTRVIQSSDWQAGVETITRPVALTASNRIEIETLADAAGATVAIQVVRHVRDVAGPTVSFTTGEPLRATGIPYTLVGTATDVSGVSSVEVGGRAATLQPTGRFEAVVQLLAGLNTVPLVLRDCEGNTTTRSVAIALDSTPPSISVLTPHAKDVLLSNDIDVRMDVNDEGGVALVLVNGVPASRAGTSFSAPITLPNGEGPRAITVVARDTVGNESTVSMTVFVDLTPPVISAATRAGWTRPPAAVIFTCSDAGSAVVQCPPAITVITEGSAQAVVGDAVDAAGRTASATAHVSIDATAPSVVLNDVPGATQMSSIQVDAAVGDALSGLREVTCGGRVATVSNGVVRCTFELIEGVNELRITAEDFAGNVQTASSRVILDSTPPALSVDTPNDNIRTNAAGIRVAGTVDGDASTVTVNGVSVPVANGTFAFTQSLQDGVNVIDVTARDAAGNIAQSRRRVSRFELPTVTIDSPLDLAVVSATSATVTGQVSIANCAVVVNGVAASVTGTNFRADAVPLAQGRTVITAAATTSTGRIATASVNVYRDSLPPRVVVYGPADGTVVSEATISVTGMVDDVVVGTINGTQMSVRVNGVAADVANRAFVAHDVPLTPGLNVVKVQAVDAGGNTAETQVRVTYTPPAGVARIVPVSGNGQISVIGASLPQPLIVRLVDATGSPVAGRSVRFAVIQNDGALSVGTGSARSVVAPTNAQGEASVRWTLGTRAGAGNNRVEATSADFGTVVFDATARTGPAAMLVVDSGSNQFGIVDEPLPRPIVAVAVDRGGNRLSGVDVTFTAAGGGGSIDGRTAVTVQTDSDGRAWVTPRLGGVVGQQVFTAAVPGLSKAVAFTSVARVAGPAAETQISGVVVDNTNTPIAGVTIRIDGSTLVARTDAQGLFALKTAPVGYVKLIVDGSTALRAGTWPTLEYALYTLSGQDNTVGMPIYLLPIDVARGVRVDERTGGTLTFPELPGFSLTIAPGSALFPGGSRAGTVSATIVHADKMPMPPGFGQQPRFLVTIQPTGVHFEPPAALTFPNLDGLPPGSVTEMYSFDHDLGQFVSIGTGSVSEDGLVVVSDVGVGIIKGGWHCGGNPTPSGSCDACNPPGGSAGADEGCRKSDGTQCVPDPTKDGHACRDDGNPCTEERCQDGICQHRSIAAATTIESRFVDRDDPTRTWADGEPFANGQPLYANDTVGDYVSWRVRTTGLRSGPTGYTWRATGPETVNGPGGAEWRIDGLRWKPGYYHIEVQIKFGSGCVVTRGWMQPVGIRTDDYILVGAILEEPLPTGGVQQSTIDRYSCSAPGCSGLIPPPLDLLLVCPGRENILANNFNDPSKVGYVPETPADRLYVSAFLFTATANTFQVPPTLSEPRGFVSDACGPGYRFFGLDPLQHFRQIMHAQFKYLVRDGRITSGPYPVGDVFSESGMTPEPCRKRCGPFGDLGPKNGRLEREADGSGFSYYMQTRAGSEAQAGWHALNRRELPYVFFRMRFDVTDGKMKSRISAGPSSTEDGSDGRDYSYFPTFHLYRRVFTNTYEAQLVPGYPLRQNLMGFLLASPPIAGSGTVYP